MCTKSPTYQGHPSFDVVLHSLRNQVTLFVLLGKFPIECWKWYGIAFVLLYFSNYWSKKVRHSLSQSNAKLNHDLMSTFSCASGSLVIFLWILIGSWRSFPSVWLTVVITFIGFDFKTLSWKALYYSFVNCMAYHLSVCHHNPCNKLLAQSICWVVLGWPVWNRGNYET